MGIYPGLMDGWLMFTYRGSRRRRRCGRRCNNTGWSKGVGGENEKNARHLTIVWQIRQRAVWGDEKQLSQQRRKAV